VVVVQLVQVNLAQQQQRQWWSATIAGDPQYQLSST
jgi:hypothetical protein